MRIAVVSDTHGHVGNTTAAVHLIQKQDVQAVLHCGDIGSPAIIPLFAAWPTHFVFGNVDHDAQRLAATITAAGQTCHERFGSVCFDGIQIAFLHSDDLSRFAATIDSGDYNLVCYGHTHVAEQHRVKDTLVLNPGALFRATPHTLAIVDLPRLDVKHLAVA
ncbi:MAG: metallophosphoesterase [Planctomycetaceae bacterium]|nr:metallophosphoesterase [Planctomycetaceae bacterium]